jgi:adiponectin receptor
MIYAMALSSLLYVYAARNVVRPGDEAGLWVFRSFLVSCLVHAPWSVGFHALGFRSRDTYWFFKTMDHLFVYVASVFLTYALSYHSLFDWPVTRSVLVLLAVMMAIVQLFVACFPVFREDRFKFWRVFCAGAIVQNYLLPTYLRLYELLALEDPGSVGWGVELVSVVIPFLCFVFGGLTYGFSWPDCRYPGVFDLHLRGHVLMHFALLGAHLAEFLFICMSYHRFHMQSGGELAWSWQ